MRLGSYKKIEHELKITMDSGARLAERLGFPKSSVDMKTLMVEKYGPQPQWVSEKQRNNLKHPTAIEVFDLNGNSLGKFDAIKDAVNTLPGFSEDAVRRAYKKTNHKFKNYIIQKI